MKRHKRSFQDLQELMDRSFAPVRNVPPEQEEAVGERVLQRLRNEPEWGTDAGAMDHAPVGRASWPRFALAAVATLTAAIIVTGVMTHDPATAEKADGSLYRIVGEKKYSLQIGQRIDFGETLRSGDEAGAFLTLADGTRVEMRSKSELVLERAEDGVRIHLGSGSVIVNAAKQRAGHLYVQTKDLAVSVVGTAFFVNAEEEGSRVAVFEGEVRVKQGETERSLRPGEQVSTNPATGVWSISQQISWSREAEALMALLQQLPQPTLATVPPLPPVEKKLAFEEVSIRPIESVDYTTCQTQAGQVRIDPGRMVLRGVTVYWLILNAYQKSGEVCGNADWVKFLSWTGTPKWFDTAFFDIEATIPRGDNTHRGSQVRDAENIQLMIRSMLEDRFKLKMHQISQQVDGYVLKMDKDPLLKMTPWKEGEPARPGGTGSWVQARVSPDPRTGEPMYETLYWKWSMKDIANSIEDELEKPVMDATGLKGGYNWVSKSSCPSRGMRFLVGLGAGEPPPCINTYASADSNPGDTLDKKLGFKLEKSKVTVQTWVIDHVEKPSEN